MWLELLQSRNAEIEKLKSHVEELEAKDADAAFRLSEYERLALHQERDAEHWKESCVRADERLKSCLTELSSRNQDVQLAHAAISEQRAAISAAREREAEGMRRCGVAEDKMRAAEKRYVRIFGFCSWESLVSATAERFCNCSLQL